MTLLWWRLEASASQRLAGLRLSLASDPWPSRLGWTAIAWIVVFWRLGYPTLIDPDEAHYAQLTREMLQSRHWLVPMLDGAPFIDKPVFFHWLQGLSIWILGESEFAVRLPTALAAIGTFAFVRWLGVGLFGISVAEWGALMFATLPLTFMLSSVALFDMVFTFFLFGSVACLLRAAATGDRRLELAAYGLLTFAAMTKGPVALLLMGVFIGAGYLAGDETRAMSRWLRWQIGLPLVLVAASPWFVWMYFHYTDRFVHDYLLAGNLWYFTQPEGWSKRAISTTFYARALAGGFFPCSFIMLGRGIDVVRHRLVLTSGEKLLWLWVAVVVGFFSIARFKLDHYIFPAAPACALLAGHAWRWASQHPGGEPFFTRAAIFLVALAMIFGGAFGGAYLFLINLELPLTAVFLPLSLIAGGVALLRTTQGRWRVPATPSVVIIGLVCAFATVVAVGFPTMERVRPMASIAKRLRLRIPSDAIVATYRIERWRGSLRYYVGRPVQPVETPEDLRVLLDRPAPAYVVMLRTDYEALRDAGVPLRPIFRRRGVVKTTGTGIRKQHWDYLVVATRR
jgi:4-amino-4-deoxy-L-arabinose transferase-like glycosyltransferase